MGRRLTVILACALIVGIAIPAYAEVQNIKVSGDITARFVERAQMDFSIGEYGKNRYDDVISAFLSTVRLRVDADLTENVSAVVRLINERTWGEKEATLEIDGDLVSIQYREEVIQLDLAYLTLKEFLYEPLTLIIGRQNLRYGTGFVVGDPNTNQFSEYSHYSGIGGAQFDTIIPEDLSSLKAFDAIRAILNYDPMIIDLVYAKIDEGLILGTSTSPENDDVDLWGVNVAYDWGGDKNLATETYLFYKDISDDAGTGGQTTVATTEKGDRTFTIGTRAHLEPIERLYLAGEVAIQRGTKYNATGNENRDRKAFAYQLIAQYGLDMKYSPVITTVLTHYSGDKDPGSVIQGAASYKAWDPMFEDVAGGKLYNALFPATNCNIFELSGQITPIEDVNVTLSWAALWLDEAFARTAIGDPNTTTWTTANDYASYTVNVGKKDLGHEIDVELTYDYTEDVQFGLNAGWFMPGAVFSNNQLESQNKENAYQVIASVMVNF